MGTINLRKGAAPVSLSKNTGLEASVTWPASTDYDLGAEILYRDGTAESIATFSANGTPARLVSKNGTVRHGGDATRGAGTATETITVQPDPDIAAIAFWAYSAQSNGTGSFRRYAVSMKVSDGSNTVQIDAVNASPDDTVYTCVPGIVTFADGAPSVEYAEMYSKPGSELRPTYAQEGVKSLFHRKAGSAGQLRLDGPRNTWK